MTEVQGECGPADTLTRDLWLPEVGGFVSAVFRHLGCGPLSQLHDTTSPLYLQGTKVFQEEPNKQNDRFQLGEFE